MELKLNKGIAVVRILLSTAFLQMKQSFARPMFRFCILCNPVVNAIFLYELYFNRSEQDFITYAVLGAGLMGMWSCICFSSVGDINRERYSGTLPLIYVAPGQFGVIVFGKILGNTILSIATFAISYITAAMLTGTVIKIQNMRFFLLSMLLLIICFMVVSICFAYVLMLSRKTELYMNLLEIPIVFLCGFTFPVEILPETVKLISNCIPITWAVKLLRISIGKINPSEYGRCSLVLLIELLFLIGISVVLYRWIDKQVRIKGTLEVS